MKFTSTYIYISKPRTYLSEDPLEILGNTVLVTSDTHKFFIPYVFFKQTKCELGSQEADSNERYCMSFTTDKDVLSSLFPGKKAIKIKICLMDKLQKENISFICENIQKTMLKNHGEFNQLLSSLKELFSEITANIKYIFQNDPKVRKKQTIALSDYYIAKGNLIRTSFNTALGAKLEEFEINYTQETEIKEFFCENYVVNDSSFYYSLDFKRETETG